MLGNFFLYKTCPFGKWDVKRSKREHCFFDCCTRALKIDANLLNFIPYVTSEFLQQLQDVDQVAEVSGMIDRVRGG